MNGKVSRWMPLLLAAAALFTPLRAEDPGEVLNPRAAAGSYVSDGGAVLGPEYARLIDGVCRDLQARTTVELAVVTVGDLGGLAIEEFAEEVFRRFGIGASGSDNGLLLLCSRDDRAVRLEVGYGLEADIPDITASLLLEESGLPFLRQGLFGRGLFLAARAIAAKAAAATGMAFQAAEPSSWPEQVALPAPLTRPVPPEKGKWDPLLSSLYFAAGLLLLGALGMTWTRLRFGRARGRAARAKALGGAAPIAVAWTAAAAGLVLLLVKSGGLLHSLVAMTAAPGLATTGQLLLAKRLRRRLSSYRLPCARCGAAMEMAGKEEEERLLDAEEKAEEKAGGMDYEFWRCSKCGAEESLAVKLDKAGKCPQCKRRSLTTSSTTLEAATREHGGKTRVTEACLNPKCNYSKTREHSTPRLSSPGSGSPGGRSSSGSFGGGRSGGGGASKHF